jgi:biopolymer transport protein TolR
MLVLLVIFMVTAPMMMQGVDVSLPETTSQPLAAKKENLVITINNQNQIFINNFQVAIDFLQEKLKKILEGRDSREVYLRADREISYGFVVRVMAEIKAAGVDKLGMVTEPISEKKKGQ